MNCANVEAKQNRKFSKNNKKRKEEQQQQQQHNKITNINITANQGAWLKCQALEVFEKFPSATSSSSSSGSSK